jgi:hypothetical protein
MDAEAVFYLDEYKPTYFEVAAQIMAIKPTAGWNANAYVIFDYFSASDFKFTGIDVSLNKLVMGYRDATGWHVVAQAPVLGSVKSDTWYDMLVAINGTTTTVSVNQQQAFTYTFAPRVLNGEPVGLNKGFIGAGSNNSRGSWDNFVVQVLPPELTLDSQTSFTGGIGAFTGNTTGAWTLSAGRYGSVAAPGATSTSIADYGVDGLQSNSHVEILTTLSTSGIGGVVFDRVGDNRFKFVAVDVAQQSVLIGHFVGGNWVVDASVAKSLVANTDYTLLLTIKGTSVSVSVGGVFAVSFGFNAPVADGGVGVLSRGGTTSVDAFRLRTNDSHFTVPWVSVGDATVTEGAAGGGVTATLTLTLSRAAAAPTSIGWSTVNGTALASGDFVGASGIATFAAGATTAQIAVAVIGDSTAEANEVFDVALASPTGLTIGDDAGQVTILNDDKPTVSIQPAASVTEGNSGSTTMTLTVTLSAPTSSTVTVVYATANGTATAPSDYVAKTGTLTFVPGVVTQTISITVNGDRTREQSETFSVNVTGATNATVAGGTATVTIVNDDGAALTASGVAPSTATSVAALGSRQLEAAVALAEAAWIRLRPNADFSGVSFSIGDLDGALLGVTAGRSITIDSDAAGWGWRLPLAAGASSMRVDLVTVVMHELGHVLGLDHDDDGLMAATLAAGAPFPLPLTPTGVAARGDTLLAVSRPMLRLGAPTLLRAPRPSTIRPFAPTGPVWHRVSPKPGPVATRRGGTAPSLRV